MASKIKNDEIKRQALLEIAQGRAELTAQSERLCQELNPKLAARKLLGRHPGAVVLTTFTAGLLITLMLFGRRHGDGNDYRRHDQYENRKPKACGSGFLGILIRGVAPALVKIAVGKPVEQLIAKMRQDSIPF